jgi:hypothetical protein
MLSRSVYFGAAALAAIIALGATDAGAVTMQECSAKYKAAQSAGTLNGKNWNQFRKDECGSTAAAVPAKSPPTKAESPAPQAKGNAVFPTGLSSAYSKESAGKARMHTWL